MSYVASHLGVDITFTHHGEGTPVHLNIEPSYVAPIFKAAEIGTVTVNGKQMTSFERHEKGDFDALEKLRLTLKLDTQLPFTIYTVAEVRLRRYESELEKCRAALALAYDSLKEITIDPTQFDFGPAYSGAQQRQLDALRACRVARQETK